MPGVHRQDDSRFCGATTVVSGQSSVFVNNKLWAVEGDLNTHGAGQLVPVYGPKNVYVENKLVICAVGDKSEPDDYPHPPGNPDPKGHSMDVVVYGGAAGGGSGS
jgi:hypothetical protein